MKVYIVYTDGADMDIDIQTVFFNEDDCNKYCWNKNLELNDPRDYFHYLEVDSFDEPLKV